MQSYDSVVLIPPVSKASVISYGIKPRYITFQRQVRSWRPTYRSSEGWQSSVILRTEGETGFDLIWAEQESMAIDSFFEMQIHNRSRQEGQHVFHYGD